MVRVRTADEGCYYDKTILKTKIYFLLTIRGFQISLFLETSYEKTPQQYPRKCPPKVPLKSKPDNGYKVRTKLLESDFKKTPQKN